MIYEEIRKQMMFYGDLMYKRVWMNEWNPRETLGSILGEPPTIRDLMVASKIIEWLGQASGQNFLAEVKYKNEQLK